MSKIRFAVSLPALVERWYVAVARTRLRKRRRAASVDGAERQLLVDVSVIHQNDAGTGIQRVVRGVFREILANPPRGFNVRLVGATRRRPYRYLDWDGGSGSARPAGEVRVEAGDIFLGLDLAAHIIPNHYDQLARWKTQGVELQFMVYDLLALRHPEWFSSKLHLAIRRWIRALAILADGVICISQAVRDDLSGWLATHYGATIGALPSRVVPMGADIASAESGRGRPVGFEALLSSIRQGKTALMVGTLEPRKGHGQVLDAFELLWNAGKPYRLVIAGRAGWKTDVLQQRLRNHPRLNDLLFWLDDVSDHALIDLYSACDGVIVASLAEGFGLPLIEAHYYGKPVLARDLAVFRETARVGVDYFSARDGLELSSVVAAWIERVESQAELLSSQLQLSCTWRDTASAIVSGFERPCGASSPFSQAKVAREAA